MIRVRAKTIAGRHWQPKTRRNRAVPISRALRDPLDRYRSLLPSPAPQDDCGSTCGGEAWYFPAPQGGWFDPDNFSRELRRANQEARLQWACLDYRHTFGSQLAQRGVSLFKIATLMGNSPEICRRHYASLVPEAMHGEVEFSSSPVTERGQLLANNRCR